MFLLDLFFEGKSTFKRIIIIRDISRIAGRITAIRIGTYLSVT